MSAPNPAEVIAEHGLLHWHAITGSHAPRVRAVCLCGYEASEDIVSSNLAGRQARRMLAPHQVSKLSEHGYSIVQTPTVEWFILKGGFFKQRGRIYSGPYVDREDAFRARNTIERIEDTHEYFIDSRPIAAAAAEEDQ